MVKEQSNNTRIVMIQTEYHVSTQKHNVNPFCHRDTTNTFEKIPSYSLMIIVLPCQESFQLHAQLVVFYQLLVRNFCAI